MDGDKSYYEGFIKEEKTTLLAAINPVSESGSHLIVSAPLDRNLERRLKDDYDIYAALIGSGGTSVNITESSITVTTKNENGEVRDEKLEKHLEATAERANEDPRRMISWAAFLVGDSGSIKQDFEALAVVHVPLQSVYSAYVAKHSELGKVLLLFAGMLLGLFLLAELVSVVIGVAISRRITRSVHDMYKGAHALRSGNLQHEIPVRRNDQLGLLAQSFNEMSSAMTRLLEEVSEKKRLEKELEIAREVQSSLFPKQLPHPRGLSIFGGCQPAQTVSGDYYDFIVEDEARIALDLSRIRSSGSPT